MSQKNAGENEDCVKRWPDLLCYTVWKGSLDGGRDVIGSGCDLYAKNHIGNSKNGLSEGDAREGGSKRDSNATTLQKK